MMDLLGLAACLAVAIGFRRIFYPPEQRTQADYRAVVLISVGLWYLFWLAGWI